MTFGIDISTHQAGLDIADARAAGAEFCIVKSVASYLPQLTVAENYRNGIDRVIAAGLGHAKGHYAVPNNRNTPQALAQFQIANRYRAASTDVYMLDNEPLDGYPVFWRDPDAAAYFVELNRLGVRWDQMWLYCPAALTRSSGPWPRIEELRKRGLKIVWVSYGDNDPYREAGEEPLLGGGITGWDVHQFTSTWRVPGYPGNIDGNFSWRGLPELFAARSVSLESQMRAYIAVNQKPAERATWDQMCGSLMFRFNTWRGWKSVPNDDISSAYRVWTNSRTISTDPARAPLGAWHFFDIGGEANGHVMQDARGGGTLCLSTGYALSESLGKAIGFQSVAGYIAAKGARYLGWTQDYAGGTIDTSNLSGLDPIPIENEETDMTISFIKDAKSATIYAQSMVTGDYVGIKSPYHLELLERAQKNRGDDPMLVDEMKIVRGYIDALDNPDSDRSAEILAAIQAIAIDPAVVKDAVKAAFDEGFEVTANVSPEDLDAFGERFAKLLGVRLSGGTLGTT